MVSENDVVGFCKDVRLKISKFKYYNRPARILTLFAFVIPLAIIIPTSPEDEKGESDYAASPYAIHAGLIFLAGLGFAYILSKKASRFKISINESWAVYVLNAYEGLIEYQRPNAPEEYWNKAENNILKLINEIKDKIEQSDDKIRWIIPFTNPVEDLLRSLELGILPQIKEDDKNKIPEIKSYLVSLMRYLIRPSKSSLEELSSYESTRPDIQSPIVESQSAKQIPFGK